MTSSTLLGFDTWVDTFSPLPNISKTATSPSIIKGDEEKLLGFETYGSDLEFIKSKDPTYVWTLVQEDDCVYIKPGVSLVNRLIYLVTYNPWSSDEEVYLYTSEDELD